MCRLTRSSRSISLVDKAGINLKLVRSSNELQSHSIDSRNYLSPKSEVVDETNSFKRSPIQHVSGWPRWLGIRLQTSDVCCSEFNSHWRQLFLLNLFCRIYLSDRSSVRFAYRDKPNCSRFAPFIPHLLQMSNNRCLYLCYIYLVTYIWKANKET